MEVFMTPLKRIISLAKDAEITYKILKAEDLLSELGLNQADQIKEQINQISNEKYNFDGRSPNNNDLIEDFLLNGYLNEKGRWLSSNIEDYEIRGKLFDESYRKALFYAFDLTSTCHHCAAQVQANLIFCNYCGHLMVSEKENKAILFIKNSNLRNEWDELDFSIGGYHLKVNANENYPPLFLFAGTYKYDICKWIAEYRGIGNKGSYDFVGNESYDLIFSLENSSPGLQIIHKTISD